MISVGPGCTESLLQHIWQFRLYNAISLETTAGEPVDVLHPGVRNRDAGPDFTSARVRIGAALWAGQVELHMRTSDWYRHGHQYNRQYDSVVLHVVLEHDMAEVDRLGIPCVELGQRIPLRVWQRYEQLLTTMDRLPCAWGAAKVPALTWQSWKERLLAERWERKTQMFQAWLLHTRYNWEEVCFWAVAQGLGVPVNALPFLQLAQSLPHTLLMRHRGNLLQLEALLFGQAGMLHAGLASGYPQQLYEEYSYLRHKYSLEPMEAYRWRWLRMRPSAFPSMRIAMLAALLHGPSHLFSRILEAGDIGVLERLFTVPLSAYWQQHYRFDTEDGRTRQPGRTAIHNILINTVLPLLYLYGQEKAQRYYQERALQLLGQLPAEENRVVQVWEEAGIGVRTALDTQALLQLKQHYCDEKRCLACAVGAKLLREE
ncbi:DUF2851 family protein [Chitinophaga pendula]|uniref:DUF2851 family protein n=1 Tax=Chitinophaga TaxID=79328 RepID=UPI000BB0655F|nr:MULTISPECIES: DUF2851 family protein [Chitinophaga]ASZ11580.1 hypothetical protein CK934_11725 [Chitinophaga sp. MD30]UCJ05412.1 DUF2851 family protein [Chitinophaga pendula]